LQFCFEPHELAPHHTMAPFRQTLHESEQGTGDDAVTVRGRYYQVPRRILAQRIKQRIFEREHLRE
jgi:hypothetical protein